MSETFKINPDDYHLLSSSDISDMNEDGDFEKIWYIQRLDYTWFNQMWGFTDLLRNTFTKLRDDGIRVESLRIGGMLGIGAFFDASKLINNTDEPVGFSYVSSLGSIEYVDPEGGSVADLRNDTYVILGSSLLQLLAPEDLRSVKALGSANASTVVELSPDRDITYWTHTSLEDEPLVPAMGGCSETISIKEVSRLVLDHAVKAFPRKPDQYRTILRKKPDETFKVYERDVLLHEVDSITAYLKDDGYEVRVVAWTSV